MKKMPALFLTVLALAIAPTVFAQSQAKLHDHAKGGALKATATAHSVILNFTNGTVPSNVTCPAGVSGSTAITSNSIFRGNAAGGESTTPLATVTLPLASPPYTDSAVSPGVTYFYTVNATSCNGASLMSNEVSATIPNPQAPPAPVASVTAVQ